METIMLPAIEVAEAWERWGGGTTWSRKLRWFGELGGQVTWWGGYPQTPTAIPLCFTLHHPNGEKFEGTSSRLGDIQRAIVKLESV